MIRYLIMIPAFLALMVSCGGSKTGKVEKDVPADSGVVTADTVSVDSLSESLADTPMPTAADELFDDFIFNFAANKKLQMERIAFPLTWTKGGDGSVHETITRKQWKMEYYFMRQHYYTLLFDDERQMETVKDTAVHHAVVEMIYFNTGAIIQHVFDRRRGAWMLTGIRTIPFSQSHNASFLEFYKQFANDADFQTAHLNETIDFVGPDPDDDFSQMEGVITPDTWEAFAPELPHKMIYNIVYGAPKPGSRSKVFVLRGIANGLEVVMTFKRVGEQWKLTKLST